VLKCPVSDKHRVVVGVKDRLMMIRDRENPLMDSRPPIFISSLGVPSQSGPKTIDKLIEFSERDESIALCFL